MLLAACGKGAATLSSEPLAPVAAQGAVSVVTRNTSRIGGQRPAADAAAVARAVYPGLTAGSRPQAVVLVDEHDWSAALAASVLAGAPVGAPILFSEGATLPDVTRQAIEALHPRGLPALGGVQLIRLASTARVPGMLATRTIPAQAPAACARALEQLLASIEGAPPTQAIVVPEGAPRALTMPAAGLAAESGAPILYVEHARVPAATSTTLASMHRPSMYVIDPSLVSARVLSALRRLGRVTTVASTPAAGPRAAAVANAIAIARFTDGSFGWGVKEPGHGLVFANLARPLDGPAAALLSASGNYGPLLLLAGARSIPAPLAVYLGDIQPAYTSAPAYRPVRGVYNHGWLIGDESAIAGSTQAEIDSLLEISPSRQSSEEAQSEQNG